MLRGDIVRAAAQVLDASGEASSVTLRAVAREAGISAPAIYAHFADPHQILMAVTEEAFERLAECLRLARDQAGDEAEARLRALAAAYLEFADQEPSQYRVMFGGLWSASAAIEAGSLGHDAAVALGQDALKELEQAVRACVQAGRSSSQDPHADTIALWLALHGLAHQRACGVLIPWPANLEDRIVEGIARLTG